MKNDKRFLLFGFLVVAVAMTVGMVFDYVLPDVVLNLLGGEPGVTLAFAGFAGAAADETIQGTVPATLEKSKTDDPEKPNVDKPSFSKRLTKIFPSKFPLDTVAREMPKGKTDSDEYKYASVVARALGCTVQTTMGAEVTSPNLAEITLTSAHMLSVDGNLMLTNYNAMGPNEAPVKASEGAIVSSPLILHIVTIDRAASKIKVFPVNANAVPKLEAGQFMARVGVAKDQLTAMSEDPVSQPTYDSNYCQINMATVSEAYFQKLQEKEVEWGMADMQESALYDFRMQSEMAMLFGAKRFFMDPVTGKGKYLMDGFIRKVGHTITNADSSAGVTEKFMNEALAQIFDGNNGSEARIMFYGSDFGLSLSNNATFQKQLEAGKTKIKFGITWNEIETNQGLILAKKHDAFKLVGYGNAAMVIDPANFRRVEQRPLTVYDLDLEKSGIQRSKDRRIDESFTLEVTNPETHGLILG